MPIGQIEIALRPIKLAFLVDPNEKDAVLRAIQINTFLWGGMFNPIIPVFRKRPKNWEPFPSQRITPSEIISGYLNAYDPDFVVPLGRCTNGVSFLPSREVINADDILSTIQDEQVPNYGIGLFELLNHIYEQEFKFVSTHPPRIAVPALSSKHHLFLASIFGVPPADIDATIRERYDKPLSIERPQVSITDYTKLLTPKYLFLRRISAWQLRTRRGTGYREGQSVFYMDASNTLDVIDYWNLRAIGWGVIPVARQVTSDNHIREIVIKFIEENYVPYRHNQQMYHQTTILKSRHVTEDEVFSFAESLDLAPPKDPHSSKYVYSMIWDNWAREKDEVDYCEIEADTQTHEFQEIPKTLSFRTVDPPMLFQYRGTDTPCFANTIKLRFFGHDADPMADIIPEGDERVVHAIGAIGWREWRVGPRGLIYLSHYRGDRIIFNPPRAEEVFSSWLKANGWEVNLSSPGRIAKQVLKQVDGVWGMSGLASPGVISLLVRKLSEGKILSKDGLWAEANKIAQQQKRIFQPNPSGVIQSLTDRNIIRLGVNIQCPVCQQHSWHSVSALDYQVSCEKCLHEFRIPSHSPDDLQWAYRAFGPFSLPKGAYGVYPVLLTLRFFAQVLDGATTPIMSFEAKGHGYKVEADLGLFFQKMVFGREKRELIFAECKTGWPSEEKSEEKEAVRKRRRRELYNSFEKKDIQRMKKLAQSFPGAVIVFSTLNSTLGKSEKNLIRSLAMQGRRHWRDDRSYNPVLILTATELFADFKGLAHVWEEKGGRYADFARNRFDLHNILPLCDLTQQLYLDMPSWHEWRVERIERRHAIRAQRTASSEREALPSIP